MKNRFSHISVLFRFKTTRPLSSFSETVQNAEFVFFFKFGTSLSCTPLKITFWFQEFHLGLHNLPNDSEILIIGSKLTMGLPLNMERMEDGGRGGRRYCCITWRIFVCCIVLMWSATKPPRAWLQRVSSRGSSSTLSHRVKTAFLLIHCSSNTLH